MGDYGIVMVLEKLVEVIDMKSLWNRDGFGETLAVTRPYNGEVLKLTITNSEVLIGTRQKNLKAFQLTRQCTLTSPLLTARIMEALEFIAIANGEMPSYESVSR
ncbi:hypothetical protein L1987_11153 [Smallanthus sonchifolius]|uniref:Uncharacterized protein n=1 Tax=Smallanthus sonchifolius TaxID=185202 RepID=A0ACB9JBP4_9ASTR|nr:hypothetical protein L1987_11153 [Smallanthus sonchifolius]